MPELLDPLLSTPRILLAEDNPINRAVASGILEKQGHKLTYAGNGREAVDACKSAVFDVILMDIQMPEMDGFEAMRLIREMQAASGSHTPILAMTAHAMTGDRERCLAGGMDGYISKPLSKEKLVQAIAEFSGSAPPRQASPVPPEKKRMHSAEQLLEQLGDNPALVEQVIEIFAETIPGVITELNHALTKRDAPTLGRTAHKLIGSFGAIGADGAASLARDLETAAEKGDFTTAARVLVPLQYETNTIPDWEPSVTPSASLGSERRSMPKRVGVTAVTPESFKVIVLPRRRLADDTAWRDQQQQSVSNDPKQAAGAKQHRYFTGCGGATGVGLVEVQAVK